jgi:Ca2+-binding EF-hand superfamily protein
MKTTEMDKIFRLLDVDHDGKLTADEAPSEHRDSIDKLIAEADKNKDGALSKIEFRDGLKRLPELGPQLGESDPKLMFQLMDTNHDKQLTAEEIPQALRPLFDRLLAAGDKNGDGALSRQEFGKASSQSQPKSATAAHKPTTKKKPAEAADPPAEVSR